MVKVRTRVAPSPTGDPHVGTAYVALVNYAFAKGHGGDFLLRIEDTDRARSTPESERAILDSLHWLGIAWDEGPDVGGPHGPYRQSERAAIYREHVDRLLTGGYAFKCFCTPTRLDDLRVAQRATGQPSRYDGLCIGLPATEVAQREAAGEPFVVRIVVPTEGTCIVQDARRGPIEIEWRSVDMQVLMKSDGLPTYHLANVVDDHLMEITHVIRGEEWVSSAPKHLLLYKYFGWTPPQIAHLPLLRNPDKSKLSKRKNPTSILFYQQMGYLPESLLNFLGLLAAGSLDGEELFSLKSFVEKFELDRISLGGPVFDVQKLDWLNGRYLREQLDDAAFVARVADWGFGSARIARIAALARPRIERLGDLGELLAFLFAGRISYDPALLASGKLDALTTRKALAIAQREFDALREWNAPSIDALFKRLSVALEVKTRDLTKPFYVAISGSPTSIPLYDAMEILGRDLVRERLRHALEIVGVPSKREQEDWKNIAADRSVMAETP
ncbi:MAG TPA: glutamate--tRNA ligase [Candidatus Dormibacteraeota bacterium]|nr:glutamate--tRNA ligase [Candidatus Dormibacteraeota bacterium]